MRAVPVGYVGGVRRMAIALIDVVVIGSIAVRRAAAVRRRIVVAGGGREGEAGGRAGAEEGLVARPDLQGRRAHKGEGEGVGAVGPPEDDACFDPVFACAVATDDRDAALFGDEFEHFDLLGVGLAGVGEGVRDEAEGVVAELREGGADALGATAVGMGVRGAAAHAVVGVTVGRAGFVRLGAGTAEEWGDETHA